MQRLDEKSLRRKVTIYIATAMLILTVLTIASTVSVQNHRVAMQQQDYSKQIHLGIEHVIKHYIREYSYKARRIIETENIVDLMKTGDRETLYKMFKPKWDLMVEEQKYLKIMHFHSADGKSFLRMHLPKLYGDSLVEKRPMIKEIHTKHKAMHGYETGKYSTIYRILRPIFDKSGEYIGAFEIGINPKFILKEVHDINGLSGMMFIKEDSLELFSKPNKVLVDGYRLQTDLTPEFKKISVELEVLNRLEDNLVVRTGEQTYKTHLSE